MHPVLLLLGAGGAGVAGYKLLTKKPAVQVQPVTGTGGVPLQVVTPVANFVTPAQKTGKPTPAVKLPDPAMLRAPAKAQTVPGRGTVYAPPKMVDVSTTGSVQMAPIVISPTGASSVAIGGVLDVQKALNMLGYTPRLKEDGKLGPMTTSNIKKFQSKAGLVVDGSAGSATQAALSNAIATLVSGGPTAPVAAAATAAVAANKPSAINTAKDVQHALNLVGAKPPLKEDGKAGPMTVAAIKSFQLTHGLTVDGVAGPKTRAALGIAVGASPPAMSGQFGGQFG